MTHQNRETFIYKVEELESLHQPFRMPPKLPDFLSLGSLCWVGYNGTWSIKNRKLYLADIHNHVNHVLELNTIQCFRFDFENDDFSYETVREPIPVKAILKNLYCEASEDGLLANWFTGNIYLGLDEITLEGMHNKHEKYLSMSFELGICVKERVLTHNEMHSYKLLE